MRGFLASLALVETIYLVRCVNACLGAWVKPWAPELNRHKFSKELKNGPQAPSLVQVLAVFLIGGVMEVLVFAFSPCSIPTLGVGVRKGRNMGSLLLQVYLQGFGGSVGGGRTIGPFAKGGNSSVPNNSGTCREECWAKLREGFFVRKKILCKRVPEAEAGMGWITLGKWVQKLQSQFFLWRHSS